MNGVLIVNKPKGYTSHDVVAVLRKALNTKKIGHTGTLDPNATGILPILVGQGVKLSKYLIENDKTYIAVLKLGEKTDTGDSDGIIVETDSNNVEVEEENVSKILAGFLGKQKQIPPSYSAVKVNGKKLYEYAREGKDVEVKPRDIEIYDIELKSISGNEITFETSCSKGTYIRVLCEDIAEKLGTVGYMKELQRICVR
ncbi:MAG: tRNA pseudouridine(55) synthase TruB [Oscillospiraceae bacterium]|nr:tRNA pseudouridine(55) synthase TruB [Oscillospiraceae bacterium]